ncbi:predicted protein [Nematostella vectensis]|uniref:Uncharacterized protein n=1 Tax=Nematostella vectensis TaxID=45351 RepID=A7RWQ1_NEMVE|nr:uncharacterized protein LOC5515963 [Nematostella vectensis]EDO44070.1 predicted protein [Nematostella vectensis]|eukprot:XP_001636133.1 predicted protein [Nematostella vectensis]
MATDRFEFFSRFRHFGSSLDKDCSDLKTRLEEPSEGSNNEGRCHVVLREILSDVVELKNNASNQLSKARESSISFGEFMGACEKLATNTKENIDILENHLLKYGYKKTGELPSIDSIYEQTDGENKVDSGSDSMEVENTGDSPDSDNGDTKLTEDETNGTQSPNKRQKMDNEDDDPLKSPVRPNTLTQMIQITTSQHAAQTDSPSLDSPLPPQTTTPMLKFKTFLRADYTHELSTPEKNSPIKPNTQTPMLGKKVSQRSLPSEPVSESPDNVPLPPVLATPGLKVMGVAGQRIGNCQTVDHFDPDVLDTPTPPDLTTVVLLKPEEMSPVPMASYDDTTTSQEQRMNDALNDWMISPVSSSEHAALPSYIRNQFTIDGLNYLLSKIGQHLAMQKQAGLPLDLTEQELYQDFGLGSKTKAFQLLLGKLNRAKLSGDKITFFC